MRQAFIDTASALIEQDPRTALVLADISAAAFEQTALKHPDRVLNVGIREQLMIGVAGGLALTGLRPIAHSYATFLIDRAYEQIKLDLAHQGVGAILVSVGASYDGSSAGYTHMSPMDVQLIDTLPGWTVHVPGHPGEVASLLTTATAHDDPVYLRLSTQANDIAYADAGLLRPVRHGTKALVVAVGPMLAPVLEATRGLDVTVAYTHTPRPFDTTGLRELAVSGNIALIEPYLAGTSAHVVSAALADRPHRLLSLGVTRRDLHSYGTPADHARQHGLDPTTLRTSLTTWLP
ncbi:transketolase [Catellatospora methionotrophica]|uniref:Transketolase n=1 Tax=Catellatospora methionotrophica TaxID=121620 RepID=A0A8J3LJS6_9ACTN|nr:transketolase [Catellatospora methionotrophica]GIG13995.1 transketolase [Catellatospora methionotrophica]